MNNALTDKKQDIEQYNQSVSIASDLFNQNNVVKVKSELTICDPAVHRGWICKC